MLTPVRPNARKPWTTEEEEAFRRMIAEGVPPADIANRLGRTLEALSGRGQKLRLSLGKNSLTIAAERRKARGSPESAA